MAQMTPYRVTPKQTLMVDDGQTLIAYVKSAFAQHRGSVAFATSFSEGKERLQREQFGRVVADLVFEGEDGNGVDLLSAARLKSAAADLILLTGKPVNREQRERLRGDVNRLPGPQDLARVGVENAVGEAKTHRVTRRVWVRRPRRLARS